MSASGTGRCGSASLDYRHTAPAMLFVARYPGENGDDGYLRYETLQRLTEGIVDWP